ncbi:MAG: hypothetical protein Ta2F_02870 [Termitinemataceae bacterium]|nr:MAG: hypothetical protein Ta2F_02870 [Termitinemataceae bacterium]
MKKLNILKSAAIIFLMLLVLGCDEPTEQHGVSIPESVGENELAGKTYFSGGVKNTTKFEFSSTGNIFKHYTSVSGEYTDDGKFKYIPWNKTLPDATEHYYWNDKEKTVTVSSTYVNTGVLGYTKYNYFFNEDKTVLFLCSAGVPKEISENKVANKELSLVINPSRKYIFTDTAYTLEILEIDGVSPKIQEKGNYACTGESTVALLCSSDTFITRYNTELSHITEKTVGHYDSIYDKAAAYANYAYRTYQIESYSFSLAKNIIGPADQIAALVEE